MSAKSIRAPLADRTSYDAQCQNIVRSASFKKETTAAVRTWKHDPYQPVEFHDVDMSMYDPVPLAYCSVPSPYATPFVPGLESSMCMPRVTYVNGRPIVLSQAPVMEMTPANISIQDISFESSVALEHETPSEVVEDVPSTETVCDEEVEEEEEVLAVDFHHHRTMYYSNLDIEVGECVVVEGDRGYDVGHVAEKYTRSSCPPELLKGPKGSPLDWALRRATPDETRTHEVDQVESESEALEKIRSEVERLHLPMTVKRCEFQYDHQKLSFYFEARDKVMFVPLLKSLHREFQCRIWLQQINRGAGKNGGANAAAADE